MLTVFKIDGVFYLVTNLTTFSLKDSIYHYFTNKENLNMWTYPDKNDIIMGNAFQSRASDILRYIDLPFTEVNEKNVSELLLPLIKKTYDEFEILYNKDHIDDNIFIADKNAAYVIGYKGKIHPVFNFYTTRSDYDIFIATDLLQTKHLPPLKRIASALENAFFMNGYPVFPLAVISTDDPNIRYINSEEDL